METLQSQISTVTEVIGTCAIKTFAPVAVLLLKYLLLCSSFMMALGQSERGGKLQVVGKAGRDLLRYQKRKDR
jgi:hypothetical protein